MVFPSGVVLVQVCVLHTPGWLNCSPAVLHAEPSLPLQASGGGTSAQAGSARRVLIEIAASVETTLFIATQYAGKRRAGSRRGADWLAMSSSASASCT